MTPLALSPGSQTAANFLATSVVAAQPATSASLNQRQGTASAKISATILTKNSEAMLAEVLAALDWCDEIVLLDTGSGDATLAIANRYPNVSVHQLKGDFPGFGRAHQIAVELARNDWIFSVDSDEVVTLGLRAEIAALRLDEQTVYVIPFDNFYNGKLITTCGWAPDRHERLFNRRTTNFCASSVHERVCTGNLRLVELHAPIRHYSYRSLEDFLRKMNAYSQLFAQQNKGRKRSSPGKAVSRGLWAFLKSYVLERGVLQGTEGLVISSYKAQTVFWKYMMLHESNAREA